MAKLGHSDDAAMKFRAAAASPMDNAGCADRVRQIVRETLATIDASAK
jgi:hypothetical protein